MADIVSGRNPVREALRSGTRTINKILVSRQAHGSVIDEIVRLALRKRIPLHRVPSAKLDTVAPGANQGIAAEISATEYLDLDELCETVKDAEKPLIVILDGIEDPHNLGAIIRNAVAFGADGVVIGKWRAAGFTDTVVRTSAGASEHIPIARVTNIAESISRLKDRGFWVTGTEAGGQSVAAEKFAFPLALVIGSEGKGLHRLVRDRCDNLVAIPQTDRISSLNASCAAAVVLYEAYLQKNPA